MKIAAVRQLLVLAGDGYEDSSCKAIVGFSWGWL